MEIVEMAQSRRALWRPRPRHFVILPLLPPRDHGTKWALYPKTLFPPSEQKWRNRHLCSQTVEQIPNHSPGLHVPSRREQVDSAAGSHFAAQQKVEQQWLTTDTQVGPGVIMFYSPSLGRGWPSASYHLDPAEVSLWEDGAGASLAPSSF